MSGSAGTYVCSYETKTIFIMKFFKKSFTLFLLLSTLCFISSRPIDEKYVIDRKESVVKWRGSMVLATKGGHAGYVYISKGELMIEENQLVGGTVEVDMSTLADESHGYDNNLVDHLKSPDFFDVKKFPIATFAITKVTSANGENIKITGNLTIKGIAHEVTFPAKIEVKD